MLMIKSVTTKITKKEISTKKRTNENVIYVGNKPTMRYLLAVITEFNGGLSTKVAIKARGRAISKAVDVVEIVRNRFITNLKVEDIKIDTVTVTNDEGITKNVSSIEIYLVS